MAYTVKNSVLVTVLGMMLLHLVGCSAGEDISLEGLSEPPMIGTVVDEIQINGKIVDLDSTIFLSQDCEFKISLRATELVESVLVQILQRRAGSVHHIKGTAVSKANIKKNGPRVTLLFSLKSIDFQGKAMLQVKAAGRGRIFESECVMAGASESQ